MARCTACDLELARGADRCPRCLRKSTVRGGDDVTGSDTPPWIGVRAGVAMVAIASGGAMAWLLFTHDAWLRERNLVLPAAIAALALVTMPLRVAFRLPSEASNAREALRFYVVATLAADGLAVLFAAFTAIASVALSGSIWSLPVGLVAFLLFMFAAPVAVVAVRRPQELAATAKRAGKQALVVTALVLAIMLMTFLGASRTEKKTIYVAEDPKSILDPMDIEHVKLAARTTRETDGTTTRNLSADGGDMKRTLLKLDVAAMSAVDEAKRDTTSSGFVRCWIPPRMRTPENAAEVAREQAAMESALVSVAAKTPSGRAIHIRFDFGDLP
jgi:hypothetical protein